MLDFTNVGCFNRMKQVNEKIGISDDMSVEHNKNIIFVYTTPKVGSTTLVSSLRISLGKTYNIIHIHDEVMLSVLTGINNITVNEMINYLATLGKNVFVIDVYRTPIERKISEFFERSTSWFSQLKRAFPEVVATLKEGKKWADDHVQDSLYRSITSINFQRLHNVQSNQRLML